MTDSLALHISAIPAHEKHTPTCLHNQPSVQSFSRYKGCSCDQSQRADARLARVLREAVDAAGGCSVCGLFGAHGCINQRERLIRPLRHDAFLAVVGRAAHEGGDVSPENKKWLAEHPPEQGWTTVAIPWYRRWWWSVRGWLESLRSGHGPYNGAAQGPGT